MCQTNLAKQLLHPSSLDDAGAVSGPFPVKRPDETGSAYGQQVEVAQSSQGDYIFLTFRNV